MTDAEKNAQIGEAMMLLQELEHERWQLVEEQQRARLQVDEKIKQTKQKLASFGITFP